MGALLLVVPWSIIFYALAKKYSAKKRAEQEEAIARAVADAFGRYERQFGAVHPAALQSPQGAYAHHLEECAQAAAMLNLVRPAAIAADISALMSAPDEAVQALSVLAQPIDVLTVQKDLNVLGAQPKIAETGQLDRKTREAIRAFQAEFRQPETGTVDPGTAIALRYATGVVHFQNQMGAAS